MNNDKPASESHPTFESIMNEWGDDVGCGDPVEWVLRHYDLKRREQPLSYSGDRSASESSHSPTEQPGDSANNYKCADCGTAINEGEFKTFGICGDCWDKHHKKVQPANNSDEEFKKLVMDTFHELYPYSSGPHLNELFVMAERATKYERSAAQARIAELEKRVEELKQWEWRYAAACLNGLPKGGI